MAEFKKDLLSLQYSENFNIQGTQEEVVNLILNEAQEMDTTVYGVVVDGETPVPGATVKVFDSNGNPYLHTVTDEDGNYTFDGLPVGSYNLAVSAPGYTLSGKKVVSLTVGATVETNFSIIPDETLSLGAVYGIIFAKDNQSRTPIGGVKLSLLDESGELVAITYSVDDGEFAFYDLADGNYFVLATAQGYLPTDRISLNIIDGSFVSVNINMIVDARSFNGTVNGVIADSVGRAVTGCFVGLYEITEASEQITERLVSVTKTNQQGEYFFGGLEQGNYIVKAKQNAKKD